MNVHVSYKVSKTPDIEKEINHYLGKLQKRLQVFRPELVSLKGIVEQNSPREGFVVSLNLRLPSGQMAAQSSGPAAAVALKTAFDDLIGQLHKHKEHLRNQHNWPRWRRGERTRPMPQVPFEETVAATPPPTVSHEDITSYVNANLRRLQRYVERELTFRENADLLAPDQVTTEEVVDEAIANALGDGLEKPERLALEPWLYRLAMHAIDELADRSREDSSSLPLEQSARRQNVRGSDDSQLQYHQPDEQLMRGDVIADRAAATPEEIAASDEMINLVELSLLGTRREDREAFILYAVEGFTMQEIAAITDRKPDEVRASVAAAREHLRTSLPVSNEFKQKFLEYSKAS